MDMTRIAGDWPGKSKGDLPCEHPAIYHMLDVAAVAERLLARSGDGLAVRDLLVLFVALHDLGKINAAFRAMLRKGQPQTAGAHWEVTEALLRHHDGVLASHLGGRWRSRFGLYAATAGHHGSPPWRDLDEVNGRPVGDFARMLDTAGAQAVGDSGKVIEAFLALWPDASLDGLTREQIVTLGWRLAGLVNAADWIGSNPDWFPATPPGPSVEAYLERARERAEKAVAVAGLDSPAPSDRPLFDFQPRPMQDACRNVGLPEGPMLAVIEDETGTGKTEAALMLVQRMLRAGKGRGLYFALPTMATADAMFARVAEVLIRLYEGAPSLALAHGRAGLSDRFRALAEARSLNPDVPGPTDWLRDNRRRALLSDVGVGTVDQALLAVVRAKYAPLRLHGLSSKILIVDEVHEMGDPYMGELLAELLHAQAALGGSAILLSATLPLGLRNRLIAAFERGAGREAAPADSRAYPALTVPRVTAPAVVAGPAKRGPVAVERLESLEQGLDLVTQAASKGAACVVIRNAVDEAIATCRHLHDRGVPADLLHARFALHDRKRHEARALSTFGKARVARPGRVLVATQVVESSLDLDFDVMVSDLAPMASLIQRAGRLWRHMDRRPADTRAVPGPVLHVLAPDPDRVEAQHWAQPVLGQGAWVYDAPSLWRTARTLLAAGRIGSGTELRDLVEAAESDTPVPELLERAEIEATGKAQAGRSLAWQNRIDWAAGYREGAAAAADDDFPTRLGQPQKVLILACPGARGLEPWSGGGWTVDSCQLSEVQASARRLDALPLPAQDAAEIAAVLGALPDWIGRTRLICPVGEGGMICEGLRYDADFGLLVE